MIDTMVEIRKLWYKEVIYNIFRHIGIFLLKTLITSCGGNSWNPLDKWLWKWITVKPTPIKYIYIFIIISNFIVCFKAFATHYIVGCIILI